MSKPRSYQSRMTPQTSNCTGPLPGISHHRNPDGRLVYVDHVVPGRIEHPIVPEAVPAPAGTLGGGILDGATNEHHERRAREVLEVPVGNTQLVRFGRKIPGAMRFRRPAAGRVPLAPASDRADVDMIDLRIAGVAAPEGFDETFMVIEEHGIVVVREDVGSDLDAVDPFVAYPLRRRSFVHGHDAEREGLPLGLCLPDHVVHQAEVVSTLGWLELVPRPAEVGDGLRGISAGWRRTSSPS